MSSYKDRSMIVHPFDDVKCEQIYRLRTSIMKWNHIITPKNVNQLLTIIMEVPELVSTYPSVRIMIRNRVNDIIKRNYYTNLVDKDILQSITDYFEWLKQRSDYVEEPEIIFERVKARTKAIRQELIEVLYHPGRYEKMIAMYGEVWGDIHFD